MKRTVNRYVTNRLISVLAQIPKWMLPHRNLRRLKYQGQSKHFGDPLSRPENLELVPCSLICSIVFTVEEIETLRESIIQMVESYGDVFTRSTGSDISDWFERCVDREGAAAKYLHFSFSSMVKSIRPTLFTDASVQISQWTPSFVVLAFESPVSEKYVQRFYALEEPYEWQYELSTFPLSSSYGLRVYTGSMRRLEEKKRILNDAAEEIRDLLNHFGINTLREKVLTLSEVFTMSSSEIVMGNSTNISLTEINKLFPVQHLGYLNNIGILEGLPDYIGFGLAISRIAGKTGFSRKSNTVLINTPDISKDERTPISNLHYSLLRWASVQALIDYSEQQRSIALKARWNLYNAVSPGLKRISNEIKAVPKSLKSVRQAALMIEILHDDLIEQGDLTRHLSDPISSLFRVRRNTRTSILEEINYRLSRLLKPVTNYLTIAEKSGAQFLQTRLLLSNRKLQVALLFLSFALLALGVIQLYVFLKTTGN